MYEEAYLIEQQLFLNRSVCSQVSTNKVVETCKVTYPPDKSRDVYYLLRKGLWPNMHKQIYPNDCVGLIGLLFLSSLNAFFWAFFS